MGDNMSKDFIKIEIEDLLNDWEEAQLCMATDVITCYGNKVGYMYREEPDRDTKLGEFDSGWRFFAGDEEDEYVNNPANIEVFKLNTICNYNKDIIPFLKAPYGSVFFRNEDGVFVEEKLEADRE
jgi:hypothetical protein